MRLIVSFSFGLAAMLIIIGVLLVRSLVERIGSVGSSWCSALPLCSAVIVTVPGASITLSGLATYLGRN